MRKYLFVFGVSVCLTSAAAPAEAEIASFCLRPVGIPDKWVENQTPPWDPTDTFDPSGPNPDVYLNGFNPAEDHGTPLALTEFDGPLVTGQSMIAVQTGFDGAGGYLNSLVQCSQFLHPVGGSLSLVGGLLQDPRSEGIDQILSMDPDAVLGSDGERRAWWCRQQCFPIQSPRDRAAGNRPGRIRGVRGHRRYSADREDRRLFRVAPGRRHGSRIPHRFFFAPRTGRHRARR